MSIHNLKFKKTIIIQNRLFAAAVFLCVVSTLLIVTFNYKQNKKNTEIDNNKENISAVKFVLKTPWKIENTGSKYTIRLVPYANIIITDEIKIQLRLKITNSNNTINDGFIFGNMLPGANQRWVRLFYYSPDNNWALEYMKGAEPTYYTFEHNEINGTGTVTDLFIITISKDGKNIDIEIPNKLSSTFTLKTSLYEKTRNMFPALLITPQSTDELMLLNIL